MIRWWYISYDLEDVFDPWNLDIRGDDSLIAFEARELMNYCNIFITCHGSFKTHISYKFAVLENLV